jgi:CRP/FNR family cyclic AMP-dependent transcriptional regulator
LSAGHDKRRTDPIRWPRVPGNRTPGTVAGEDPRRVSLLDLDDDLAEECDPATRAVARGLASVQIAEAEVGPCELASWYALVGPGPGLLVLDGLVAINTSVGDRAACELIGAGDLLQRFEPRSDELVIQTETCNALSPTRFALLDEAFAGRVGAVPQLSMALLRRAARRASEAETLRAIACHPRLEVRLVLLLWHLASRWGRVVPGGIRLTMPLTHRLLGQLVAAERPSVSHALHRLAQTGLIVGTAGDLLLEGSLESHFEALREPLADHINHSRLSLVRAADSA